MSFAVLSYSLHHPSLHLSWTTSLMIAQSLGPSYASFTRSSGDREGKRERGRNRKNERKGERLKREEDLKGLEIM